MIDQKAMAQIKELTGTSVRKYFFEYKYGDESSPKSDVAWSISLSKKKSHPINFLEQVRSVLKDEVDVFCYWGSRRSQGEPYRGDQIIIYQATSKFEALNLARIDPDPHVTRNELWSILEKWDKSYSIEFLYVGARSFSVEFNQIQNKKSLSTLIKDIYYLCPRMFEVDDEGPNLNLAEEELILREDSAVEIFWS